MSTVRNKQRLLYLYKYLLRYTDEEHQVTTNEIVSFLRGVDASASRKTVKDDIEALVEEGFDIVTTKSYYNSYFVGERMLEESEVKLLVDMVASCRSLSAERKEKLIEKLLKLLSVHQAERIRGSVLYSNGRIDNEQVYYNIYVIMDAIRKEKKIEFLYYDYSPAGERMLRHNGEIYACSPYGLTFSDNRYYMVGYSDKREKIVSFRIDRMLRANVTEDEAVTMPENFALDRFVDKLFYMHVGDEQEVVFECSNELMRVIVDTFGSDIDIWKSTVSTFYVKTHVNISPAFYGWLFQFGGDIKIISPVCELDNYMSFMRNTLRNSRKK